MADDTLFRAWVTPSIGVKDGSTAGRRQARISLSASIAPAGGDEITHDARVLLHGPADVDRISSRQIRRMSPRPGYADAEGEYNAYIDFADPDFPWRYSPEWHNEDDAMRPWLALVAGGEGTDLGIDAAGRAWLSARVTRDMPPAKAWQWAHVHEELPSGQVVASRLLCPLRLPDDAECLAVVVPLFRTVGSEVRESWQAGHTVAGLPVFHSWRFRTNEAGTFTSLATALKPMASPGGLGTSHVTIDLSGTIAHAPVYGLLAPIAAGDAGAWSDPAGVQTHVADLLDSSADPDPDGLPVLGPPRYGARWVSDVETTAWGVQLNRDPRYRGIAALGTQAGIDWQQEIVAAASQRVGDAHRVAMMLADLTAGVALSDRLLRHRPGGRGGATQENAPERLAFYGPALLKARGAGGGPVIDKLAGRTHPIPRSLLSAAGSRLTTSIGRRGPIPEHPLPTGPGHAVTLANECRTPLQASLPAAELPDAHPPDDWVNWYIAALAPWDEAEGTQRAEVELGIPPGEASRSIHHPGHEEAAEPICEPIDILGVVEILDDAFDPHGVPVESVLGRIRPRPANHAVPHRIRPDLDLPAWTWLRDHAPDWLLPRAGLIPNDRVVALRTNGAFIESFLIGLSQQAVAELRWRGVPMAGTSMPMRTIWQRLRAPDNDGVLPDAVVPDIFEVTTWDQSQPLDHPARHNATSDDLLVIVIRSEILRRYPETVVRIVPAIGEPGELPIAIGKLAAGLWFLVFDISPELIADRYLVLEETIDGPRFAPRASNPPANGAEFAKDRWARPVRAFIDGQRFLDPDPGDNE